MKTKPLIGITMGCPVSIGPEIIIKFFSKLAFHNDFTPIIIGDLKIMEYCSQQLDAGLSFASWQPQSFIPKYKIPVFNASNLDPKQLEWGKPTSATGKAMAGYITAAVELIQKGHINAMATCPIAKSSLNAAGFHYPGHTEMLADLTGADNFAMMMAGKNLKVTLVTIHKALKDVPSLITREKILNLIELTDKSIRRDFAVKNPAIAVAGLNPHAGEEGLFGEEERLCIAPAVAAAREKGIDASGPFPPDTVFYQAAQGNYQAVVCMYHDQGLIPFKLLHFSNGVNLTLGLPIIRTSVDHGTAYDIAGKGMADSSSLEEAVYLAAEIIKNRKP